MTQARTPPRWFEAKLRAINRKLRVRWEIYKNMWVIEESVPWAVDKGRFGAGRFYSGKRHWMRVVYAQDLGSRILDYVRRVDMRRFSSMERMIEELEIDKSDRPGFSQTAVEALL